MRIVAGCLVGDRRKMGELAAGLRKGGEGDEVRHCGHGFPDPGHDGFLVRPPLGVGGTPLEDLEQFPIGRPAEDRRTVGDELGTS